MQCLLSLVSELNLGSSMLRCWHMTSVLPAQLKLRIDNTEAKCLEYRENFLFHAFLWTESVTWNFHELASGNLFILLFP